MVILYIEPSLQFRAHWRLSALNFIEIINAFIRLNLGIKKSYKIEVIIQNMSPDLLIENNPFGLLILFNKSSYFIYL